MYSLPVLAMKYARTFSQGRQGFTEMLTVPIEDYQNFLPWKVKVQKANKVILIYNFIFILKACRISCHQYNEQSIFQIFLFIYFLTEG